MRQYNAWMRRGLALLVAWVAALGVVFESRAEETIGQEVVDGIEWNFVISDGEASLGLGTSSVPAISTNTAGAITVPATLGGVPVTAVGQDAFYHCTNLTSVLLPERIRNIGGGAFDFCANLKTINLPNSLTNIESYAFAYCRSLESVVFPPSLKAIQNYAFDGCESLKTLFIPDTVQRVESGFHRCTSLVSAEVHARYSEMGFSGCPALTNLQISSAQTYVNVDSTNRVRVVFLDGVKSIGLSGHFKSVSFPDTLEDLSFPGRAEETLSPCDTTSHPGLLLMDGWVVGRDESVPLPECLDLTGIRGLVSGVLDGVAIKTIVFPDTLIHIHSLGTILSLEEIQIGTGIVGHGSPFSGCSRLKTVIIKPGLKRIDSGLFSGLVSLENITIPDGVESIGDRAFQGCPALASISIPGSVAHIGSNAFANCSALATLGLGDGIKTIDAAAFSSCGSLTSVSIPGSVAHIGSNAFANCSALTTLDLGDGIKTIDAGAFSYCGILAAVTIPGSVTNIGQWAFSCCSALKSIVIPGGVKNLAGSFSGCSGLESVSVPASVTNASGAFSGCTAIRTATVPGCTPLSDMLSGAYQNLASVSLAEGTTSICDRMFYNCKALSEIAIPVGVTNIGKEAFSSCSALVSVAIPVSVASIGDDAFYSCPALQDVHLSSLATWCAIPFGNAYSSPFYYAQNLFLNGELVTVLEIPDGMESIPPYAFYNCDCLESVSIPDSVKTIGEGAFAGCDNLTWVRVPQAVMAKGLSSVFRNSYGKLRHLCLGADVEAIAENEFGGCRALVDVEVAAGNTNYVVSADGCLYDAGKTTLLVCSRDAASVELPEGLETISPYAFQGCGALAGLVFPESVASIPATALEGCGALWTEWYRALSNLAAGGGASGGGSGDGTAERVSLTVTNVIVHYVTQSVPSEAVTPGTNSTGIVNVIAEVTAGKAIAISEDWAKQYPGFEETFGSDFGAALTMETGKRDGAGNPMFVWQDYVAGTDPTDPGSVFTASLTFDAETGEPVISWSPELSPAEAAKRRYTVSGKVRIIDPDWLPIEGNAGDFNFFRVAVEMR